jgi:hypothetical protein
VNVPEELAKLLEEEFRRLIWSVPPEPEEVPISARAEEPDKCDLVVPTRPLKIDFNLRLNEPIDLRKPKYLITFLIALVVAPALLVIGFFQPLPYLYYLGLVLGIPILILVALAILLLVMWLMLVVVGRFFGPSFRKALAAHENAIRQTTENTSASSSIKAGPSRDVEASRDAAPVCPDPNRSAHSEELLRELD